MAQMKAMAETSPAEGQIEDGSDHSFDLDYIEWCHQQIERAKRHPHPAGSSQLTDSHAASRPDESCGDLSFDNDYDGYASFNEESDLQFWHENDMIRSTSVCCSRLEARKEGETDLAREIAFSRSLEVSDGNASARPTRDESVTLNKQSESFDTVTRCPARRDDSSLDASKRRLSAGHRSVRFSVVQVRTYAVLIDAAEESRLNSVFPVSLSWDYKQEESQDLEQYEILKKLSSYSPNAESKLSSGERAKYELELYPIRREISTKPNSEQALEQVNVKGWETALPTLNEQKDVKAVKIVPSAA